MRITFVCQSADLSGGFRVIVTYAKLLSQRGHDVLVVSCPPARPTLRDYLRAIFRRRPLPAVAHNAPTHLDGTGVRHKRLDRLRAIVSGDLPDADVVIATWWQTAEWVERLAPQKGVKVHFIQGYEIWGGPQNRVEATYNLPMVKITIARWLKDLLAEKFGRTNITLVSNGIDLETFTSPPRGKQARPTVGFVYSAIPLKGCDVTMEAIRLARSQCPNLRIVCFGSSTPTLELPLPDDVEFHLLPAQAMIKKLYGTCDAWLFGSRTEGFGLPILEAMACRTPVIGTPAGAAPELLAAGGGMLIPLEAPQKMAEAILSVCSMASIDWRKMSDAAYATASSYTWDDATNEFEAALVRAVEGARCLPERMPVPAADFRPLHRAELPASTGI